MRPGDRRQRWQSSCNAGGSIVFLIGCFFIAAGITADKGGWIVILMGAIAIICSIAEFQSGRRGWKMRYDLPPSYYRDIKSPNPLTRQIAKESAEATLKEAKDPNRKRYAFETKK